MATDKLFSVAGISKLNGEYKVRFANDIMRIKVLAKSGHEDIRLDELDGSFTKLEAAGKLMALDAYQDAIAQSTISEYIDENSPKTVKAAPAKAVKTPQVPALKGMTPLGVKAPKTAKVTEDENVPFA